MKFDKLFEGYFNTAKQVAGKTTTRQQSARMGATPWRQGSQNLVPDRDRVDSTLNPKIERLRNIPHGSSSPVVVSDNDLGYIRDVYNIENLSKTEPRQLGTTGIVVRWDDIANNFVLEK